MLFRFASWRWLLAGAFFWLNARGADAQVAPHNYDFPTVSTIEGDTKSTAKLFIAPAFQGKAEIQLEDLSGSSFSRNKDFATAQRNTALINQQLSALTSEGWELVQVYALPLLGEQSTRYLFRKPRP